MGSFISTVIEVKEETADAEKGRIVAAKAEPSNEAVVSLLQEKLKATKKGKLCLPEGEGK